MTEHGDHFNLDQPHELLKALPDPILQIGPGRALIMNAAARDCLGNLEPDRDWTELFPANARSHVERAVTSAFQGQTTRVSVSMPGQAGPALVTAAPAGTGTALVHVQLCRDPLDTAKELLDALGMGLLVTGRGTTVLHANASAADILRLRAEDPAGHDVPDAPWRLLDAAGNVLPDGEDPLSLALRTGTPQRNQLIGLDFPTRSEFHWLTVTAMPHRAPGSPTADRVTTVFADVTQQRHAEADRKRSEERFATLVQATAQIVWTAEANGDFVPPQQPWEAFTGQTAPQFTNGGWVEAVHPDDRAATLAAWTEAVEARAPYRIHHRLRRADGAYVPMQVRAVPILNSFGEVREWIGAHADVSAIDAAQEELRVVNTRLAEVNASLEQRVSERTREISEATRFNTLLLTAAGEGIFGLDRDGRVAFVNPAAARILGFSVDRMIGADLHALIHDRDAEGNERSAANSAIFQTLSDGQNRRVDADVFWTAAGTPVPVSFVVTPTRDDQGLVTGAVTMFSDITERQAAEAQLRQTMLELKRSNDDLRRFASVASHDLQEPLRTIGSYADLLSRRYRGQLDERANQYLEFLTDAVSRQQSMIRDLLTFSQVGRDAQPAVTICLDDLLRNVASNLTAAIDSAGARFTWHAPQSVKGQQSLLLQLLTNLVGNALKFRKPEIAPVVTVRARTESMVVHLEIQDNGIGIDPKYKERIFEIFQRLHGRSAYQGNGMGLAICRKIAEYHGGRLWVESEPGLGSTFHLILPAATGPTILDPDSNPASEANETS